MPGSAARHDEAMEDESALPVLRIKDIVDGRVEMSLLTQLQKLVVVLEYLLHSKGKG